MTLFRYLTHPQVQIDPAIPVEQWPLNDQGRARAQAAARASWARTLTRLVSSAERKATHTAEIFAAALGLPVEIDTLMGENDRTATGFLPPPLFEATADRFFAQPHDSIDGWERAVDAQARILSRVRPLMDAAEGETLLIGHGAVGTLLFCALSGQPIDRRHDQPAGGGNAFAFTGKGAVLHGWRPMETL